MEKSVDPDGVTRIKTESDEVFVAAFLGIVQDKPDAARGLVHVLSARDRAVLSFHLQELSGIVDHEEAIRTTEDRQRAQLSYDEDKV